MSVLTSGGCVGAAAQALARIRELQHLNAVVTVNPVIEQQAQRADRQTAPGPLHGTLLMVKDNIDCAGMPTSLGCRALAASMATADAPLIARLKQAGALILGKASLSEFAFDVRSRSSLSGDVRHPHFPHITAGGSSGGCAAAVAAGIGSAAIGTDTGGSIRIPCAYTGLVGLRPSHQPALLAGIAPLSPSKDTPGPMVKDVATAASLWHCMSGQPLRPLPVRSLQGVRLGVLQPLLGEDVHQRPVVENALATLAQRGAQLVELDPPWLAEVAQQGCLSLFEFRPAIDRWLATRTGGPQSLAALVAGGEYLAEFQPLLIQHLADDPLRAEGEYRLHQFHHLLRQRLTHIMQQEQLDALIYPTVQRLPDSLEKMPPGCAPELAAMSGWPALTLPAGRTRNGFPVAIELMMPRQREFSLLTLGQAVMRALT